MVLDGTLLRIDRVGMAGGHDRPYYSGKHKCHGVNVQVLADPVGRLIWISPTLPGARHDMGAAREHGSSTPSTPPAYRPWPTAPTRAAAPRSAFLSAADGWTRTPAATGRYRPLSDNQKQVNTAHARLRGPGERANAQLKNWRILRKIRSSPSRATTLVQAVQTLILTG